MPEAAVPHYTLTRMPPLPYHHPSSPMGVHVLVKTIHGVPASASEADTVGIFIGV